jgi:hypothetical protein
LSVIHAKEHDRMFKNDKWERIGKGAVVALHEVLSLNLSKRTTRNHEKPQSG